MNFTDMAWWDYIILYLVLVFLTNIIKGFCCWSSKLFDYQIKDHRDNVSRYVVKLELNWSQANCYSNFPILMIFLPFINIYWRFCAYSAIIETYQNKIAAGKNPFNGYRNFEDYKNDGRVQELSIGGSGYSETSFSYAYNEDVEKLAIVKFKKTFSDSVYYIPIALLLMMFFMSKVGP